MKFGNTCVKDLFQNDVKIILNPESNPLNFMRSRTNKECAIKNDKYQLKKIGTEHSETKLSA
jgi:hypothetical protein